MAKVSTNFCLHFCAHHGTVVGRKDGGEVRIHNKGSKWEKRREFRKALMRGFEKRVGNPWKLEIAKFKDSRRNPAPPDNET